MRQLGFLYATDKEIFDAAKKQNIVLLSKDYDFVLLAERYGSPPIFVWLNIGNTSNAQLRAIFSQYLPTLLQLIEAGEVFIEISHTT